MKSFVERPEGASQSHEKEKGTCSSMWNTPCSWESRARPSSGSATTPSRLKLLSRSVSIRSSRGFAARMLSASIPKVRYFVLIRPLFPFASWFCSIWVYSLRILSKSSPWGGIVMDRAKVSWDAARLRKDSWNRMELVVDVLKLNGLGIVAVRHAADTVRPHPFIGDAVLCGNSLLVGAAGVGNGGFDLLSIRAGELLFHRHWPFALRRSAVCPVFLCRKQCHTPPCRVCPAAPIRHRSCWSGRGAAGAG